jgi:hypothetical protein
MRRQTLSHGNIAEIIGNLETRRYKAMIEHDVETLDKLLGDELIFIHSNAVTNDKAAYLHLLRSGALSYESATPSDTRIRVFGETMAMISGRIRLRVYLNGQEKELNNLFMIAWALDDDGAWRFVSSQSTPIPT